MGFANSIFYTSKKHVASSNCIRNVSISLCHTCKFWCYFKVCGSFKVCIYLLWRWHGKL